MEMLAREQERILEVDRISNLYAGKPLLQDVSFFLNRGEILCLLGPSGSGKTTLLRLLAGLEPAESGAVFFQGRDLQGVPPHRRRIGMMFQEYALFPHKSVGENIAFGLEMQKMQAAERERKIDAMLELVGLAGLGGRRIDQLSGGERQRVALARSLAPEPQLLLLDEPLGSLDRILRDRLAGEIRAILKSLGVTAIFVTHDQAEAFSVADKVAVLHGGVLCQIDTPENLYRSPRSKTVARFLGFDNFIDATVDESGRFRTALVGLERIDPVGSIDPTAGATTLLLRPDGARLADPRDTAPERWSIAGTVIDTRFLGSCYRLRVDAMGHHLSFYLSIDPPPPAAGRPVKLHLNPGSLVLLEEE